MLDHDKYLVVSEHGFLIQLEKGDIERCPHYRGEYRCGKTKRSVRSLDSLPRGCPVRTEETAHTLCPIIWLLTCMSEGIVTEDDAHKIMDGDVIVGATPLSDLLDNGGGPGEKTPGQVIDRSAFVDESDIEALTGPERGQPHDDSETQPAPSGRSADGIDLRMEEARRLEERARTMWHEAEERAKAHEERSRRLAQDEAEAARLRSEIEEKLKDVREMTESLNGREREVATREEKLHANGQSLAEREAKVAQMEKAAAEKAAEAERLNAEAKENHDKSVQLLELVKKKDAKVTQRILALNKVNREGKALQESNVVSESEQEEATEDGGGKT